MSASAFCVQAVKDIISGMNGTKIALFRCATKVMLLEKVLLYVACAVLEIKLFGAAASRIV